MGSGAGATPPLPPRPPWQPGATPPVLPPPLWGPPGSQPAPPAAAGGAPQPPFAGPGTAFPTGPGAVLSGPAPTGPVMPVAVPPPRAPRPWWPWLLLGLALLLVAGLVAVFLWPRSAPPTPVTPTAPMTGSQPTGSVAATAPPTGAAPQPATTTPVTELAPPEAAGDWRRTAQSGRDGTIAWRASYAPAAGGSQRAQVTGIVGDTFDHAAAGLSAVVDGDGFRCGSADGTRCVAPVPDGVVVLAARDMGVPDAARLMAALLSAW